MASSARMADLADKDVRIADRTLSDEGVFSSGANP